MSLTRRLILLRFRTLVLLGDVLRVLGLISLIVRFRLSFLAYAQLSQLNRLLFLGYFYSGGEVVFLLSNCAVNSSVSLIIFEDSGFGFVFLIVSAGDQLRIPAPKVTISRPLIPAWPYENVCAGEFPTEVFECLDKIIPIIACNQYIDEFVELFCGLLGEYRLCKLGVVFESTFSVNGTVF